MSELVIIHLDIVLNTKFAIFCYRILSHFSSFLLSFMHISGRGVGVGRSPNSVTDNHRCVATGETTISSVTQPMASVTITRRK